MSNLNIDRVHAFLKRNKEKTIEQLPLRPEPSAHNNQYYYIIPLSDRRKSSSFDFFNNQGLSPIECTTPIHVPRTNSDSLFSNEGQIKIETQNPTYLPS